MAYRKRNDYWVFGDCIYADVSTPKFPNAVTMMDVTSEMFLMDGGGKWFAASVGGGFVYVTRHESGATAYLHSRVLGARRVDHHDHDTFNNQRFNLRPATSSQNQMNARKCSQPKTSRFKGVYYRKDTNKWVAKIKTDGAQICLGNFAQESDAAIAYDRTAKLHFQAFALLNLEGKQRAIL